MHAVIWDTFSEVFFLRESTAQQSVTSFLSTTISSALTHFHKHDTLRFG